MVAFRPEVEKCGLVLPSRNRPHSGCPYLAQPSGSLARLRMSDQPIFLSGQPRASAMGFGMAITSGEVAIDGLSADTRLARSLSAARRWSMAIQPLLAGVHTSGFGPSRRSSQPRARASMALPDALGFTT